MLTERTEGQLLLGPSSTSWAEFSATIRGYSTKLPAHCVLSAEPDVLSELTGLALVAVLGGVLRLNRQAVDGHSGCLRVTGMAVGGEAIQADCTGAIICIPTSGTTGVPKVVEHDLTALTGRVRVRAGTGTARWLMTYHPASFAGVQVLLTTLMTGATIIEPSGWSLKDISEAALKHRATHVSGTPTLWRGLISAWKHDAPPIEQITLGGEACDQALLDALGRRFPRARIIHIYASTEAGALFAVTDGQEGFPFEWLAQGVDGVQLRVQDGSLFVLSPRRMLRYAGSATGADRSGWLDTGDIVEIVGNRVLFRGRRDSMINVGGTKVQPEEVEAVLLELSFVQDARVFGWANPISGSIVSAEVVLSAGVEEQSARSELLAYVRARLVPAKTPRLITFVDQIERGVTQKKGRSYG